MRGSFCVLMISARCKFTLISSRSLAKHTKVPRSAYSRTISASTWIAPASMSGTFLQLMMSACHRGAFFSRCLCERLGCAQYAPSFSLRLRISYTCSMFAK